MAFAWEEEKAWTGHKVRDWDMYAKAVGMLAMGIATCLGAIALLPDADRTAWYVLGCAGLFVGERAGKCVGAWHRRAQRRGIEAFDAAFPTHKALDVAGATVRRALRATQTPHKDATVLVIWTSQRRRHVIRDVHVYTQHDDEGAVGLDDVGADRGAGDSPFLPATHTAWLWGAKVRTTRCFTASLPLASAHQRLLFAAWLARTEAEDEALLRPPPQAHARAFDGPPGSVRLRV